VSMTYIRPAQEKSGGLRIAARKRGRVFTSSSRLRIVILAMPAIVRPLVGCIL